MDHQTHTILDIKEFLRPILFGLSEENLDALAEAAIVHTLPPNEIICREGEQGNAIYVLVDGEVQILQHVDDEIERHLHYTQPGEFFGEMAILQESTRTATVRTTKPSIVLEIPKDPFFDVLGKSPSLGIRLMVRLTNRLRDSDHQAIAQLRRTNEELRRALQRLERLDRTKSDFIQVSAHELRTPVAALQGYTQMMQGHKAVQSSPDLKALVDGIVTSTERLTRIFNNILDASRIMAGDLQVRRSPVSISLVIRGVHSEFAQAFEKRNLTFEVEGLDDLPYCPADPDFLYKAFFHLVNNAIKYTPDGGRITVRGQRVTTPDQGECIEVAVEDTGIGISDQDLQVIFEKFYRTGEVAFHSSGTIEFKGGGPGLGLAIAQGLILAHGGRIWAESPGYDEENCPGSRFIVRLPLDASRSCAPAP